MRNHHLDSCKALFYQAVISVASAYEEMSLLLMTSGAFKEKKNYKKKRRVTKMPLSIKMAFLLKWCLTWWGFIIFPAHITHFNFTAPLGPHTRRNLVVWLGTHKPQLKPFLWHCATPPGFNIHFMSLLGLKQLHFARLCENTQLN